MRACVRRAWLQGARTSEINMLGDSWPRHNESVSVLVDCMHGYCSYSAGHCYLGLPVLPVSLTMVMHSAPAVTPPPTHTRVTLHVVVVIKHAVCTQNLTRDDFTVGLTCKLATKTSGGRILTKRRITGGAQNCPYPLGIRLSITKLKRIIAEFDGEFLNRWIFGKVNATRWLSRALRAPGHHTAKRRRTHQTCWVLQETAVVNCCHTDFSVTWIISKLM